MRRARSFAVPLLLATVVLLAGGCAHYGGGAAYYDNPAYAPTYYGPYYYNPSPYRPYYGGTYFSFGYSKYRGHHHGHRRGWGGWHGRRW